MSRDHLLRLQEIREGGGGPAGEDWLAYAEAEIESELEEEIARGGGDYEHGICQGLRVAWDLVTAVKEAREGWERATREAPPGTVF